MSIKEIEFIRCIVDDCIVDMPNLDIKIGEDNDLVINGITVYGINIRHLVKNVKKEDIHIMQAFARYFLNAPIKVNKEDTVVLSNRRLFLKVKVDNVEPEKLEETLKSMVLQWLIMGRPYGNYDRGREFSIDDLKEMKNNKGKKKSSQR